MGRDCLAQRRVLLFLTRDTGTGQRLAQTQILRPLNPDYDVIELTPDNAYRTVLSLKGL